MPKKEKILKKNDKISDFFYFSENKLMKTIKKLFFPVIILELTIMLCFAFFTFNSCATTSSLEKKQEPLQLSRRLLDKGQLSADQLTAYFISRNANADQAHIRQFAQYYIDEAAAEGINSDVAFAQMCLETGYLRFGGLVQPEFHNYCGLGAMDADHPGEVFPDEQTGVRAHIQHLQAYATKEETQLNKELVDPRYNWVHKTKYIETIYQLAGTWAMDPQYGQKLEAILVNMENFSY